MSNTMKDAMKKVGVGTNAKPQASPKKPRRTSGGNPIPGISGVKHGKVKWFDFQKGYGFIVGEDGEEYFVYHSHIVLGRTYTGFDPGDKVTFRTIVDPNTKRVNAVNASLCLDGDEAGTEEEPIPDNVDGE